MADISYTQTTWADGSGGGTPIDATKLNNIETGISDAVAAIGPNDTTADGTLKAQIDALGESVSKKVTYNQGNGLNRVVCDVSSNGNRNITFIFDDTHSESLYYDRNGIHLYHSTEGLWW